MKIALLMKKIDLKKGKKNILIFIKLILHSVVKPQLKNGSSNFGGPKEKN